MTWRVRIYKWAVAAALASLLASVFWFFFGDRFAVIRSVGNDTFSASALGHRAFLENLRAHDIHVEVATYAPGVAARRNDVVVVLEPYLSTRNRTNRDHFSEVTDAASKLVLAAPKRWGAPESLRSKHVHRTGLEDIYDVHYATNLMLYDAPRLVRHPEANCTGPSGETFVLREAQLMTQTRGTPVIRCTGGVLVAYYDAPKPTWFVSDPDVFANHRQDDEDIAALSREILALALGDKTRVLVDETSHGHVLPPTIGRFLTTWPFAGVTAHLLLLLVLVAWAALVRFGPRRRVDLALPLGKEAMIQNAAELMSLGGHSGHMAARYFDAALEDMCRRLHAPNLASRDRVAWLQARIDARGLPYDLRRMSDDVETLAFGRSMTTRRQAVALAQQLHQLRKELTHD